MFKNGIVEAQFKRIQYLCSRRGMSLCALAGHIGRSSSYFSDIKSGRIAFSAAALQRLADYFDVSIDYLMNGTLVENNGRFITEGDVKSALFGGAEVTDEMWYSLCEYARKLSEDNK